MAYTYDYPRPALTADTVVLAFADDALQVLLVRRDRPPFAGQWALPGGFVEMDESPEAAARRELEEETGLHVAHIEQLRTFGAVDRDPRERVVSVAHLAMVRVDERDVRAASDAREVGWFPAREPPALAFDHPRILAAALSHLYWKARCQPIGRELLPECFPLDRLVRLYEVILEQSLDKRGFGRKILETGVIVGPGVDAPGAHAGDALCRFDPDRYAALGERGLVLML